MNFKFLQPFLKLRKLYEYCCEAEEFALTKPNISATSARKGMEFMVKMIYASLTGEYGVSVFEMVTDTRFVDYVNDQILINSIHYIRKMGKLFLHASLRESGWPIVNRADTAMPCAAGLNMLLDDGDTVDYILYGRDNRPLAIIEYTTTTKNIVEGRMKAIDKANKLSVKLGYKPIVYYTNGYHIYVIDQLGYKPRRVFQFHTIEELELLNLRGTMRQDISAPVIDASIAGRPYQQTAITNACNAFMQLRRHALLVMATGTGKTRTAIALSDVLLKAGWAKNILFFCYFTELTSVSLPGSLKSIGAYAFRGCSSLKSVVIPDSVTSIGEGAFYRCTALATATVSNSVSRISYGTFMSCENLISVTIPNSVKSIGEKAFYNCGSLTDVYYKGSTAQ